MPFTPDNAKSAALRGVAARRRKADMLREEVELVLQTFGLSLVTATRRQLQAARAEAKSRLRAGKRLRVAEDPAPDKPKVLTSVSTHAESSKYNCLHDPVYEQRVLNETRNMTQLPEGLEYDLDMDEKTVAWAIRNHYDPRPHQARLQQTQAQAREYQRAQEEHIRTVIMPRIERECRILWESQHERSHNDRQTV